MEDHYHGCQQPAEALIPRCDVAALRRAYAGIGDVPR
jgi:hypothetical protein